MDNLREKINVDNAKYLMSLKDSDLKKIVDPEGKMSCEENGERLFTNIDTYVKQLKKWLKFGISQMNSNGYIKTNYSYSKELVSCGRKYVKGFGVQKLKKNIRGFLCEGIVNDIDMKNAHPSILLNIIKKHFPKIKSNRLEDYCTKRSEFLKAGETTKHKVLMSMYHNKNHTTSNQLFCKLDKEFKSIQQIFYSKFDSVVELPDIIKSQKNSYKQNKEGKYLSLILTYYENEILTKVYQQFGDKIQTPIYDGFHLDKSENIKDSIKLLNKMTEEDGVKWDYKEFDNSIIIDEAVDIDYEEVKSYEDCKIHFEQKHFIIENPFMFGKLYNVKGDDKYQFYSKEKFRDLVKPIKFFDPEIGKDMEFFPKWIEDNNRKAFKEVQFIPTLKKDTEVFNSFKGFNYKINEDFEFDEENKLHKRVWDLFTKELSVLTNNDSDSIDYLLDYIAHLLQKPEEQSRVGIIFKSKEGFGKDLLLSIIEELIGISYTLNTDNMDDIFGTYNVGIRDKLVLVLNEVSGKSGYENKEAIKNIITEEKTIIREKYISQYEQKNFIRLFLLTNNLNPVEISYHDRRWAVFKSTHKKPSPDFFTKVVAMKRNKTSMEILFNILMSRDIEDFKPDQHRPKTEAYENMKEHNTNPIYNFLNECFINNNHSDHFDSEDCKTKKSDGSFYVKSSIFMQTYKYYLENSGMKYEVNYKTIKSILLDIGIKKKKARVKTETCEFYIIEPEDLKEQLSEFQLGEEIEELDDDDFN